MKKNIKITALVLNIVAIIITSAILIGSTFAWFNDTVVSSGNKIESGTLKVDLELLDKSSGTWKSLKDDTTPLFNYDKWEPGYTDVKILKIENEGTLKLQWKAKFVSENQLSRLAEAIEVYVLPSDEALTYPADRNLDGYSYVGTVADFVNSIETTTRGILDAGEVKYLGIALKMSTGIDNDYQGLDLGGVFDIMIIATQVSDESDAYDNSYDSGASLDAFPVCNENQLRVALANKERKILLGDNIAIDGVFNVQVDTEIDGQGHSIYRNNVSTFAADAEEPYAGGAFVVNAGAKLELTNVVIDGGAIWSGAEDSVLGRGTENVGIVATGYLIEAKNNAQIVLGEGSVVQNNAGAFAICVGNKNGATLVINGGKIINNDSGYGAIYAGGHITLNSGEISNNSASVSGGAVRMVSNCNFTMNGGEIKNNKSVEKGGAFWGYGSSTYNFNGGEISGNYSAAGGVMWPGDYSVINIAGDCEIKNNIAESAGAFRFTNHNSVNITGGTISGNVSKTNPHWNGFYSYDTAVTLSGGNVADNITIQGGITPSFGDANITGVVYLNVGTNHNTTNLISGFGSMRFYVGTGNNFNNFNFKPYSSYTYVEGDESKLICLNEGYETYYDATAGLFRLKATEAQATN